MFVVTKVLSVLIYPLGLFFMAVIAAGALRLLGWRRTSVAMIISDLVFLWIVSTPVFAQWAYWQFESLYPPAPIQDTPTADVAILLGGVTEPPLAPRQKAQLDAGADRVVHAADLYRAGKVRAIIVSGGAPSWIPTEYTEAAVMAHFLEDWGVPRQAILIEPNSRTTYDNATRVAELWRKHDFQSALLVTSAAHMRRALGTFRKVGLPVVPSTADVQVVWPVSRSVLAWMPDAEALQLSTKAAHELVGFLVYRWRGWL